MYSIVDATSIETAYGAHSRRSMAWLRSPPKRDPRRRPAGLCRPRGAYFAAGGKGSAFDAKMANILTFLQDARHAPDVVKIA